MAAFRAGDPSAFPVLYDRYVRVVHRVCSGRLTGDEAPDAVQETFARLMTALRSTTGGINLERYIKRAARNVCIDVYRRRPPVTTALTEHVLDQVPDRQDVAATVERRITAGAILSALRPLDQALLVAHHAHDMSLRDVADAHSSTPGSVKVLVFRARANARAVAQARGLRALWPVALLSGGRRLVRRATGVSAPAAIAAVVPILAVIVVTAPPWADGRPATSPVRGAHAVQAPAESAPAVLHETRRDGRAGRVLPRSAAAAAARPSAAPVVAARERSTAPRQPVADVPWVAVPGTDRQLRGAPPAGQTFDYDYGAQIRARDKHIRAGVAVDDEPESRPAHEAACTAAEAVPAALHCVRGPSRQ